MYGYSIDLMVLTVSVLPCLAQISPINQLLYDLHGIETYLFSLSSTATSQYLLRYPLSGSTNIPKSTLIFLIQLIGFILSGLMLYLACVLYPRTRLALQKVSKSCVCFVGFLESVCAMVLILSLQTSNGASRYNIYWLDFLYVFSFSGYVYGAFRLLPQATLNFSAFSSAGYPSISIRIELVASLFQFLSGIAGFWAPSLPYPNSSSLINHDISMSSAIFQGLTCMALLYQHTIYKETVYPEAVELENLGLEEDLD